MSKSSFEKRNYPAAERKPSVLTLAITIAVVAILGYFAYSYWWSCHDFGILKFCSALKL